MNLLILITLLFNTLVLIWIGWNIARLVVYVYRANQYLDSKEFQAYLDLEGKYGDL